MITRRDLLTSSLAAAGGTWLARAARAQDAAAAQGAAQDAERRVLVVVQMSGGNDGLNTVVPWTDDRYHAARPKLRIPADKVLRLDARVGLHPALARLHARFQDGEVAVVQGVGYPRPNRSHFRSMAIWHAADPEGPAPRAGWLGRWADGADAQGAAPSLIVHVGSSVPLAVRRERAAILAFDSEESFRLAPDKRFPNGRDAQAKAFRALCAPSEAGGAGYLDVVRRTAASGLSCADDVLERMGSSKNEAKYPRGIGERLAQVARMVRGGMPSRVYYTSFGSFDTHAKQADTHASLLGQFAEAVDAFFQDLKAAGRAQDVVLVTFSEFGRRLAENGSAGTDHGTAGPMFVVGPAVRGGVVGDPPDLEHLVDGDPQFGVDFRAVYAALVRDWLRAPVEPAVHGEFARLDLVRAT